MLPAAVPPEPRAELGVGDPLEERPQHLDHAQTHPVDHDHAAELRDRAVDGHGEGHLPGDQDRHQAEQQEALPACDGQRGIRGGLGAAAPSLQQRPLVCAGGETVV